MKEQIRKLNLLSRFIDLSMFYSIDISGFGSIRLQGTVTEETFKRLLRLFDLRFNEAFQWFEASRNSIHIILTLPTNAALKYFKP
jgi:hypothetical protein